MNARSALFDVYGDHLLARGGSAPVASLVKLLEPLGVAAPAVRTAVSRMVRQEWLAPVRLDRGPGYRLTPRAERRLSAARDRIYRHELPEWDGQWRMLVLDHIPRRSARDRVRNGLAYLGYAALREDTWVSARGSAEAEALLETEQVLARRFVATHEGDDRDLVRTAWDLDELGGAYSTWLEDARSQVGDEAAALSDAEAFAVRSLLVHEWRKFLFSDPALPTSLPPADWPGSEAAAYFDAQADRLLPAANRYVDACL